MRAIIVGCGRVGSTVARRLSGDGHDVVVIDRKTEAFRRLGEGFAGRTVTGIGFDRTVLSNAGIDPECAVMAVTNGDNTNILVARVARELFGVRNVVARIYDPRRATIYARLGIPTVATVTWASQRIMSLIHAGSEQAEWSDPTNRFSILERSAPTGLVGSAIGTLEDRGARILLVTRNGETSVPNRDLLVQEGDVLHLFGDMTSITSTIDESQGDHR